MLHLLRFFNDQAMVHNRQIKLGSSVTKEQKETELHLKCAQFYVNAYKQMEKYVSH